MSWVATGTMAALSVAGSIESNKVAKANGAATAASLLQNFNVTKNSIQEQGKELNRQAGMELTQARLEGLKAEATTSNVVVEREVAGNTVARLMNNVDMQTELLSDQIKQKAESNMKDIQSKLTEAKYSYEAGAMQNAIETSNNTQSTLSMVSGAVGAGMQGYAMGSSIGSGAEKSISPELGIDGKSGGVSTLGSFRQMGYN